MKAKSSKSKVHDIQSVQLENSNESFEIQFSIVVGSTQPIFTSYQTSQTSEIIQGKAVKHIVKVSQRSLRNSEIGLIQPSKSALITPFSKRTLSSNIQSLQPNWLSHPQRMAPQIIVLETLAMYAASLSNILPSFQSLNPSIQTNGPTTFPSSQRLSNPTTVKLILTFDETIPLSTSAFYPTFSSTSKAISQPAPSNLTFAYHGQTIPSLSSSSQSQTTNSVSPNRVRYFNQIAAGKYFQLCSGPVILHLTTLSGLLVTIDDRVKHEWV
jgi:hypothetical protein